ncbi:hypothetical protein K402DRAFT_460293 [Aulographum hederae CBS 113979]|uniref:Uncharacterized protein n=1 Tax=Aulographum hederae CBS 113979 TaxID=1176131 RepID=A0A6G1HCW7_9PEZI|nr:hypothetical protein K402DRAFT_460293 [Aulographum hederae CBS 113979]
MAKKKKNAQTASTDADANSVASNTTAAAGPQSTPASTIPNAPSKTPRATKSKTPEPSTSALIICRNKHWRYISSFHGPWLQLPPEVLESLAHNNYIQPLPRPIDPAVFYDVVKIRKAVDEATNLAVRATSGLTSAALSSSMNAGNGMIGGAGAAALGLGYGGTGGTAKLSRERKHRMRELATQKLSQAYHLDEIAASVATMQSASTLEDVAQFVLQRNANDFDARYVHFFHEKIPSRMMAECTPLDPLNEIISERPGDGSPWRTRALTRIFKDDFAGAARDLTEALNVCRFQMSQHRAGKDQLVLAKTLREEAEKRGNRDWRQEIKVDEEDQPSSLEAQLLFHRAGIYFSIACQHVDAALDGLKEAEMAKQEAKAALNGDEMELPPLPPAAKEAHRKRLEARKIVKTNAKRALRDYTAFLSHFDYTPGLPPEVAEDFIRRVNMAANGVKVPKSFSSPKFSESTDGFNETTSTSNALVPHKGKEHTNGHANDAWPSLPMPEVYQCSLLFSPTPPPNLPPYPPTTSTALMMPSSLPPNTPAAAALAESHEAITYHPLLTDALHSLLLCHCLFQTPPKELLRHAYNAARLARVCDGYPIFLAARSPSRADWVEVLRRAGDWIGIGGSSKWEILCRPAPLPGHSAPTSPATARPGSSKNGASNGGDLTKSGAGRAVGPRAGTATQQTQEESEKQRAERRKHEAILEALADDRVVDEESFSRAVRAREQRAKEDDEEQKQALLESSRMDVPAIEAPPTPMSDSAEAMADLSLETSAATTGSEKAAVNGNSNVNINGAASSGTNGTTPKPGKAEASSSSSPTPTLPPTPTQKSPPSLQQPKRWAQEEGGKEYPISTERADAIARWVREAPLVIEGSGKARRKGKPRRRPPPAAGVGADVGVDGGERGRVEELEDGEGEGEEVD